MSKVARILIVLLLLGTFGYGLAPTLAAQSCPTEAEPNDTPDEASDLAGCVQGILDSQDQDLYWLEVSDEGQRYTVSLEGMPEGLTSAQIILPTFNDEGQVTRLTEYGALKLFNGESGSTPPIHLLPGRYIVGIAGAGGLGPYRLSVSNEALTGTAETEPNNERESATTLEVGQPTLATLDPDSEDHFRWTVEAPDQLWQITIQMPVGFDDAAQLYDTDGQRLGYNSPDSWGTILFYDYRFPAGEAWISLPRHSSGAPYTVLVEPSGTVAPDREYEPNDDRQSANPWTGPTIGGRGAPGNRHDNFSFVADPVNRYTDLSLTTTNHDTHQLCLYEAEGSQPLQCRNGVGEVTLPDLVLTEGMTYTAHIDIAAPQADGAYTLMRLVGDPVDPAREREPNDDYLSATPLPRDGRIVGTLIEDEWDLFRLTVRDGVELWRVQVLGEGIRDFRLLASNGQLQQSGDVGEQRSRLTNLMLPIGDHYIALRGTGEYRLVALPLGEGPDGFEREPNNKAELSTPLRVGEQRSGFLSDPEDEDLFAFSLATASNVRLTMEPPEDGAFTLMLLWENQEIMRVSAEKPGETLVLENALAAGEYTVLMRVADAPSGDLYTLDLERLGGALPIVDIEPLNNDPTNAPPVPATLTLTGSAQSGDRDYYRLPSLPVASHLAIISEGEATVDLRDGDNQQVALEREDGIWRTEEALSPEASYVLRITESGAYDLTLDFERGIEAVPPPEPLDAELSLTFDEGSLAAWWTTAQVITGTLAIESKVATTVRLEGQSSYPTLTVALPDSVNLRAGRTTRIPVPLTALADLPEDTFVLSVSAWDENRVAQVETEVTASADLLPSNPTQRWPLPDALLGTFNAAATIFGAEPVQNEAALLERQVWLHDGATPLAQYVASTAPVTLTVDLAGDTPVNVVGFTLNPQTDEVAQSYPYRVELLLSKDGEQFESVYSGEMTAQPREQAIVLDSPVDAAYARLIIQDTQGRQPQVTLGEWKVLTRDILSPTANLLDPQLGGYVVESQPSWDSGAMLDLLLPEGNDDSLRTQPDEGAQLTVGFQHNRSAQIERIEWLATADTGAEPQSISVSVSNDSLIGPWQPIGSFTTTEGGLTLEAPTWARFVRFTFPTYEERFTHLLPQQIIINERASDDGYRSILAEWGHYNRSAVYEWLNPPDLTPTTRAEDDNDSLERADPLPPGTVASGDVQVLEDSDWYAVEVPPDANAIRFALGGTPTVETRLKVVDAGGNPLPVQSDPASGGRQRLTVSAPAGSTLYAQVEEPPRSIMFVWDNSGSVSPYYDEIYRAVNAFTQDVVPGREAVNYVVLGMESPLLDTWSDDPILLQRELTNYDRSDGDSEAEKGLFVASNALAFRDGVKAIVLIADAESGTSRTAELWRALEAVQPRIFTMHVHSTHQPGQQPADFQDRMQSWADANAGYYDWFRTASELENGFDRAATWLRRPKPYSLVAEPTFVEPPGPGTLRVLSSAAGDDDQAAASLLGDTAVELIVDASGSMQQSLDGERRIDIAKAVLDNLVATILPDEVPVALRAFGNREGNYSCRTDLEVPLAPLDREQMRATIAAIQPQNLAATPLAASLALVADDLATATGPRLVILLTDGEETCNGDPAAAIQQLRDSGVDVRVNIVGFAIDDELLKATFDGWARLGGGQYFDATSAEELSGVIAEALRVPFRVLAADGSVVAEGVVDGAPLELEAGSYTVELLTDPVQRYEVTVVGEQETVVGVTGQ